MAVQVWNIPDRYRDNVQLCIKAAELRAQSMTFRDIAAELGLDGPKQAQRCAETGFGLAPGEDLATARRLSAMRLDAIMRRLWDVVEHPGMKATVTGKLILDPETAEPMPDQVARTAALRGLLDADKEYRRLFGADAPKRSMSLIANVTLEDLNTELERARQELAEAKKQAEVQARNEAPKPLPAPEQS